LKNPKLSLIEGSQLVAFAARSGTPKSAQVSCVLAFTPGPVFNLVSKNELKNWQPWIVSQVSAQP